MKLTASNKWVIGLTGSILSGKSTALSYFKQNGFWALSADDLVAELYREPSVQQKLKGLLGTYDKKEIAALIFASAEKRKMLEHYLHPLVLKRAIKQIAAATEKFIVFEVPLLFESGWEKWVDLSVLVQADPKSLSARLKERKMSRRVYQMRLKNQWPESEKIQKADIVIFHRNKNDLKVKINHLCKAFELLKPN